MDGNDVTYDVVEKIYKGRDTEIWKAVQSDITHVAIKTSTSEEGKMSIIREIEKIKVRRSILSSSFLIETVDASSQYRTVLGTETERECRTCDGVYVHFARSTHAHCQHDDRYDRTHVRNILQYEAK